MSAVEQGCGPGRYVAALDGLRGVAILGVLLFHTGHLSGGFLGVDLFFALSGYLITDLLLREVAATGSLSLVAFWGRRIRRLLPALSFTVVGVTLLVLAAGPPNLVRTTLSDGPWVQANLESAAPAGPAASGLSEVLFLGDSVAAGEAIPLTAAAAASNLQFKSIASDGGGNVVGPFADKNWKKLPGQIEAAKPSAVVYQITTYDWGSRREQEKAYGRLLDTVADAGAKLVLVSMPPIKPDDFYKPHMTDLKRTSEVARQVAEGSGGGERVSSTPMRCGPAATSGSATARPIAARTASTPARRVPHASPTGCSAAWPSCSRASPPRNRRPGRTPAGPATSVSWAADGSLGAPRRDAIRCGRSRRPPGIRGGRRARPSGWSASGARRCRSGRR